MALALKTAALRALSVKNAHLNDVLQRLRIATSAQQTEKELEDLSRVFYLFRTSLAIYLLSLSISLSIHLPVC